MRVCVITGLFPPYGTGGAEAVATEAATEFVASGHEVFVITAKPFSNFKSFFPEKTKENGITVYRFFPLNIFFYGNIGKHHFLLRAIWHILDMWNIHAFACIARILKDIRPDLVLTHNFKGFGLVLPSTLHSLKRDIGLAYKWIHTVHDVQLVAPSGLLRPGEENKLGNKIFSFITRAFFCSPDVVVSPSKWLLDFYTARGFFPNSEKKVIPNPNSKFQIPNSKSQKTADFRFLYLGQLETHKGILFLIEAFKQFISSKSYKLKAISCTLTIAGGGSLLEKVKQGTAGIPEIKVLGPILHDAVGSLFGSHGATIVPSLVYENAPAVISESLAYGVPVLASRIGGIPEMVEEEGVNGWLFEPGNVASLMDGMEKMLTSPLSISDSPKPRPNYVSEILSLVN